MKTVVAATVPVKLSLRIKYYLVVKWKLGRAIFGLRYLKHLMKLKIDDHKGNVKVIKSTDIGWKVGGGSYGTFYVFKGTAWMGVKMIPTSSREEVQKELDNLRKAHGKCPDLFPKPGELVRCGSSYGYTMERIFMDTLREAMNTYGVNETIVIEQLMEVLNQDEINHNDLHCGNILYCASTGNFKVIDADPTFLRVS